MDERKLVMIGVGAVLTISTISLLAATLTATSDDGGGGGGGDDNETTTNYPLLLVSLDGFRSDYLYRSLPTLAGLAKKGVHARYLMPSFPTVTFPNHYTIVTGLHPESHGIVANKFYDPDLKATFNMSDKNGIWWGGEPIWNTLNREDKISYTYFWPGSDVKIDGQGPTHSEPYDTTVPFEDRVDKVIEWLSMSEEERPDFVSLYFNEPDHTGHQSGPDSDKVDEKLTYVDGMISRLLAGLRNNDMEDQVNIIIVSDHGMAQAGEERMINMTHYVPDLFKITENNTFGVVPMLRLKNPNDANTNKLLEELSCPNGSPFMRAYRPQDLPTRYHYSNNRRIGDIVLDFDNGYFASTDVLEGEHGYDNHFETMNAFFIATGPDFNEGVELEPFQNTEIYNLLCLLTGVDPAPNNGTEGSLYAALLYPPPTPGLPEEEDLHVPEFPQKLTTNLLHLSGCHDDSLFNSTDYPNSDITLNDQKQLYRQHLPWGNPLSGNHSDDLLLLYHEDHLTGYSQTLKMPLWTAYTIPTVPQPSIPTTNTSWFSDVRLNKSNTPTCSAYDNLIDAGKEVTMHPLYIPDFSTNPDLSYLVSNAVPVYNTSKAMEYVTQSLEPSSNANFLPMNVMMGPVFDKNADSLPDDFTDADLQKPQVPSHLFVVITRCNHAVDSLNDCNEDNLDALAFIHPTIEPVNNNCLGDNKYKIDKFLSTVHDVELVTGLTFYGNMADPAKRLQLSLKIQTNVWRTGI